MYVQAGLLEDRPPGSPVRDAVLTDPELTERQKQMLIEIYESFRKETASTALAGEAADDESELAIDEGAQAWPEQLEPAALARWAIGADADGPADSADPADAGPSAPSAR